MARFGSKLIKYRLIYGEEAIQYLYPASADYLKNWLVRYCALGGVPSHDYNYTMPSDSFFVSRKAFRVKQAYGSMSLNIFMPATGRDIQRDNIGHNNIYFEDGSVYHTQFGVWVPTYTDAGFDWKKLKKQYEREITNARLNQSTKGN